MAFELHARTEPGRRLVALAEEHAAEFARTADVYDREGRFPYEYIEALKASGYLAGSVPTGLGGMGVESLFDASLATMRLARGDASTANGTNMHGVAAVWPLALAYRQAIAGGNQVVVDALGELLGGVAAGEVVITAPASEPGTDLAHPLTEARPNGDGTWTINGTKIFASNSPAATVVVATLRMRREDSSDGYGIAIIPAGTPGMTINDDWDALGMRGSGSNSVTFTNCTVPGAGVDTGAPWGQWTRTYIETFLPGALGFTGVPIGVAEAAQSLILASLAGRTKGPGGRLVAERSAIQHQAAENEIDLTAMLAMFARTGSQLDAYYERWFGEDASFEAANAAFLDLQCTKAFSNAAAVRVVDRALTMSGGSGYMSRSPLSRLYRDVRAGSFMQPLGLNDVHEYIGRVTLGLEPSSDE